MSSGIEYRRFPNHQHCDIEGCGSRRYYIDSGRQFCKNGHEQHGFSQVQADEDDFGTQGRITRIKKDRKEAVQKVFSGRDAAELFLQAYQIILWKQVSWLTKRLTLGSEFEVLVRDLWTVRMRAVKGLSDRGNPSESGYSSATSTAGFTSTSESEMDWSDGTGTTEGLERGKRRRKAARHSGLPKLPESLGLCYLGLMLLRLPICIGELYRWAKSEKVVYIRAIRHVPKDIRDHLPAHFHLALDTLAPLKQGFLHKSVLELTISYKQWFNVTFPPLNMPVLLFNYIQELCLPVDVYTAVQKLVKVLDMQFSYPNNLARHQATAYPENRLMSLIVIVIKLTQPFDDIERTPETFVDPTALSMEWQTWSQEMQDLKLDGLQSSSEIGLVESNVLSMDESHMDKYMSWFHKTFIDERDLKMPEPLLDLFPLSGVSANLDASLPTKDERETAKRNRVRKMQSHLAWKDPVSLEQGLNDLDRPGSFYKYYRTVGELPEKAKIFYEKAAENAGLPVDMLCRCVFLIERNLQQWIINERRRQFEEGNTAEIALGNDENTG